MNLKRSQFAIQNKNSQNLENEKNWNVMEASQAVVLFTTAWLIFAFVWNKLQWLTIEGFIRKLSSV